MADEDRKANPITSNNMSTNAPPRDAKEDKKISVKALARFHEHADMKGKLLDVGDTFETHQSRAAELRANGLVEYTNESDGKDIHGNDHDRLNARAKDRAEQGKIDDRNKTTALRNPAVKLGDAGDNK